MRTLRKSPGFTAVAILTLALGIGANTSLFSVVNAVLLNPVPYPHPEQLVMIHESKPNFRSGSISYPNFRDWQHDNHSFSQMAVNRGTSFTLTGLGEAEELRAQFISSDYFPLLGVQPVIGRFFASGEDEIGAPPIVLVTENFWHRKLSGSPDAIGKTLNLDGKAFTIVGVTPASFEIFQRVTAAATDVFAPIEEQWPAAAAYRPRYIFSDGGEIDSLWGYSKMTDELRKRISGSAPGAVAARRSNAAAVIDAPFRFRRVRGIQSATSAPGQTKSLNRSTGSAAVHAIPRSNSTRNRGSSNDHE